MNDYNELKVGDVVALKSGGDQMSVQSIFGEIPGQREISCAWFERLAPVLNLAGEHTEAWGALYRNKFIEISLKKV